LNKPRAVCDRRSLWRNWRGVAELSFLAPRLLRLASSVKRREALEQRGGEPLDLTSRSYGTDVKLLDREGDRHTWQGTNREGLNGVGGFGVTIQKTEVRPVETIRPAQIRGGVLKLRQGLRSPRCKWGQKPARRRGGGYDAESHRGIDVLPVYADEAVGWARRRQSELGRPPTPGRQMQDKP